MLVAGQVALAFIMVCGAALLTRSLERLQHLDLGYRPDHLSVITTSLSWTKYDSLPQVLALGDALLPRFRAIPGIEAVTPILIPPFIGPNVWQAKIQMEGQAPSDADKNPLVPIEVGNLDYFRTMGIAIERGHGFSPPNGPGAPPEVVISDAVARRFWPGEDPIGRRIRLRGFPDSGLRSIVGVVKDIHFRSLREGTPTLFLRWRQTAWQATFAVRTRGALSAVLPAIRAAVHQVDPSSDVWQAESMDEFLAAPLAQPRLNALLLSAFGVVALLLAALGLYGVMSSTVRQQTREIGARMALGATPERVRSDLLRTALAITAIGVIVGVIVAFVSAKLITASLFDVSPSDPVALCGSCAALLLVGAAATYVPARRATGIDPARALRND
jgi:predicted permease